jgi:hypothetical protein
MLLRTAGCGRARDALYDGWYSSRPRSTAQVGVSESDTGQCVNFLKLLRLAPPLRFRDQWNLLMSLLQLLQQTFPESIRIARLLSM